MVNEFRAGYNLDNSKRQSTFIAGEVATQLGHRKRAEQAPIAWASRRSSSPPGPPGRRTFADASRNVNRTLQPERVLDQRQHELARGRPLLKSGGLYTRNMASDGFGIGVNNRGPYRFNGARRGTPSRTSCSVCPRTPGIRSPTRGPLDGHSTDFAVFGQDDWKVSTNLTVFLGLRYEIVGIWHENSDLVANFIVTDGGHHVVPNAEVAAKLPPGAHRAEPHAHRVGSGSSGHAAQRGQEQLQPPRAASRGGSTRANKTVLRGGFGLFHPTVAVQGIRDLLATNEFRYTTAWRGGDPAARLLPGLGLHRPGGVRQSGDRSRHLQAPDIYQYNLTSSGSSEATSAFASATSARRCGSCWWTATTTRCRPARCPSTTSNPDDLARLPVRALRAVHGHRAEHGRAASSTACSSSCSRRWKDGACVQRRLHAGALRQQRPDTGNSTIGSCSSIRTTSRRIAAPTPTW